MSEYTWESKIFPCCNCETKIDQCNDCGSFCSKDIDIVYQQGKKDRNNVILSQLNEQIDYWEECSNAVEKESNEYKIYTSLYWTLCDLYYRNYDEHDFEIDSQTLEERDTKIRKDTINEFVNELKYLLNCNSWVITEDMIDRIVEQMGGKNND